MFQNFDFTYIPNFQVSRVVIKKVGVKSEYSL